MVKKNERDWIGGIKDLLAMVLCFSMIGFFFWAVWASETKQGNCPSWHDSPLCHQQEKQKEVRNG